MIAIGAPIEQPTGQQGDGVFAGRCSRSCHEGSRLRCPRARSA
jgi:hypothetical protein